MVIPITYLISGKSIDEKKVFARLTHGPLQETAGYFYGHNRAIGDVILYQLTKLKQEVLFGIQYFQEKPNQISTG